MSLEKDLPELIQAGIIDTTTADKILDFYKRKNDSSSNRLFLLFGILGTLLIGLGIILIIAHNWDELPRSVKTCFAFLPLLMGQSICLYSLIQDRDNKTWRESGASFLVLAIGGSIALIGQIYNLPGNLSSFLFTWTILSLPVIYIMRSAVASLLYISLISYYASYNHSPSADFYIYWLLLSGVLPYYILLIKKHPKSNFTSFHHWAIPLSICFSLITLVHHTDALIPLAYFSLFGLFYLIGNMHFLKDRTSIGNSFKVIGVLGSSVILISFMNKYAWEAVKEAELYFSDIANTPEFVATITITTIALLTLTYNLRNQSLKALQPLAIAFIPFFIIYFIGTYSSMAFTLMNLLVFGISLWSINNGIKQGDLKALNWGLLLLMALILNRFFDDEMSFMVKGILFLMFGAGFFFANYWMLQQRKKHES